MATKTPHHAGSESGTEKHPKGNGQQKNHQKVAVSGAPAPWLHVRLHFAPPPPPPVKLGGVITVVPPSHMVPTSIKFHQLYKKLVPIDFFGTGPDPVPEAAKLAAAVEAGAGFLPKNYLDQYADPLKSHLRRLQQLASAQKLGDGILETLAGAMYQQDHGFGSATQATQLTRFLAVVSNLYRSFLANEKRTNLNLPPLLSTNLPPLAMFQRDGGDGPYTITCEVLKELMGAGTGVVSLPATYAPHPILWGALAHEVGGHDVTHADNGLLEELANGVQAVCAGMPPSPGISQEVLALLWSYWIDEATADVYGLLNIGPAFVFNLAAFFAAMLAGGNKAASPTLRMETRFDPRDPGKALDPHPTDILRLHLAAGVIDTLSRLSPTTRSAYNTLIEKLSGTLANGTTITIDGNIAVDRDHLEAINLSVPLSTMQDAARRVGGYIASARLSTLSGHSIQDIETWDDSDEAQSFAVKHALLSHNHNDNHIANLGDDAQLLAGATMALLEDPDRYDLVTNMLNEGLDVSFQRDPIWGRPPADRAFIRY